MELELKRPVRHQRVDEQVKQWDSLLKKMFEVINDAYQNAKTTVEAREMFELLRKIAEWASVNESNKLKKEIENEKKKWE